MHTSIIQLPGAGRRRGRYSEEFKRKVVGACQKPGVSAAAVALANGLNANLQRRWVVESEQLGKAGPKKSLSVAPMQAVPAFIPVQLDHAGGGADIRIQWPVSAKPSKPGANKRISGEALLVHIKAKVEKIIDLDAPISWAICLDGQNACPPEDVGGAPGYADFLEALADPANPEHEDLKQCVGGSFDPVAFDVADVNERLNPSTP